MKLGQSSIVRWVSKLVAKEPSQRVQQVRAANLRVLDTDQLRKVGGGGGGSAQSPFKGW